MVLFWPKKGGSGEGKLVRALSQAMVMRGKCKLLTTWECMKELMLRCAVELANIWIPVQVCCIFQTRDFLGNFRQGCTCVPRCKAFLPTWSNYLKTPLTKLILIPVAQLILSWPSLSNLMLKSQPFNGQVMSLRRKSVRGEVIDWTKIGLAIQCESCICWKNSITFTWKEWHSQWKGWHQMFGPCWISSSWVTEHSATLSLSWLNGRVPRAVGNSSCYCYKMQ